MTINGSEKLRFPLKFELLGIDYLMDFEGGRIFAIVIKDDVTSYEQIHTSAIRFTIIKIADRINILGKILMTIGENDDSLKLEFFDFQLNRRDDSGIYCYLRDVKQWGDDLDFNEVEDEDDEH